MPAKNKKIDVSEYELSVLNSIWAREKATLREIADDIYGEANQVQYATAQKLVDRLEKKHCVRRDRSSYKHRFSAIVQRADILDHSLTKLASKLCSGSLTPLLMHLAGMVNLTDKERKQLRETIDKSN